MSMEGRSLEELEDQIMASLVSGRYTLQPICVEELSDEDPLRRAIAEGAIVHRLVTWDSLDP